MYLCDRTEIENNTSSRVLMHRAARACADAIRGILKNELSADGTPSAYGRIVILCGRGNNGGDGILCARLLCEDGIPAVIVPAFDTERAPAEESLSEECRFRWEEARAAGILVCTPEQVFSDGAKTAMIVEALLGIGLSGEPEGVYAQLIDCANDYARTHRIPTVAIDLAAGIFADTGKISDHTFRATHTLAISHAKRGHLLYPGASYTGALSILDIGIPDTPLTADTQDGIPGAGDASSVPVYMLTDDDVRAILPRRAPDSHKGTHGRILIIGGAKGMCGAVYLSALAAYRCGAGLVEIFTWEENRVPLQTLLPEAILTTYTYDEPIKLYEKLYSKLETAIERASAIVVGPGLGETIVSCSILSHVLKHTTVPTVIDADAIRMLAALEEQWVVLNDRKVAYIKGQGPALPPLILTPHPGEFSAISGIEMPDLLEDFFGCAIEYAKSTSWVLNAKNARSVITDGTRAYINPTGTSALAKGGSGDVLTGITATLAAQLCDSSPRSDALTAAALAAYLHGRAAERVTARMGTRSPLASEIADALGEVLFEITGE